MTKPGSVESQIAHKATAQRHDAQPSFVARQFSLWVEGRMNIHRLFCRRCGVLASGADHVVGELLAFRLGRYWLQFCEQVEASGRASLSNAPMLKVRRAMIDVEDVEEQRPRPALTAPRPRPFQPPPSPCLPSRKRGTPAAAKARQRPPQPLTSVATTR